MAKPRTLLFLLALLAAGAVAGTARAQDPEPAAAPAATPEAQLAERAAKTALELAEARRQRAEAAETLAPTLLAELDRRISLLERLDFLLAQQDLELERTAEAKQLSDRVAAERVALVESSPEGVVALPELDALMDELTAQRARARSAERAAAAAGGSIEQSKSALADTERKRSQARAALDEGRESPQAAALEARLVTARLAERVQRAELELRRAEAKALETEAELQRVREALLRERLERSRTRAVFTPAQLQERRDELDALDVELAERAATARSAQSEAESAWARARLQLTEAETPSVTLTEAERAARLQLEELRRRERAASDGRARATLRRLAWERRQAVLSDRADAADREAWARETRAALDDLEGQEAVMESTLSELRRRRLASEAKVAELEADRQAPRAALSSARRARSSIEALATLVESELDGIGRTASLLGKLDRDIQARRGGASWLSGAWARLQAATARIWDFEIGTLNERRVTVGGLAKGLLVLLVGLLLLRFIWSRAGGILRSRFKLDEGASSTLESIAFYISAALLAVFALHVANVPLTAFTLLGGALAIGIGFGTQNLMNNFISGLILLMERPVRVGDLIEVSGGTKGIIRRIGARSTNVLTGEGVEILVPNSSFLENEVVNWTLGDTRVRTSVMVGFAYGSPTREIGRLLKDAAVGHGRILPNPEPFVIFSDFGDSALLFEVHFWMNVRRPMDAKKVQSDLRSMIDHRCREAGIVIAFPQRDVHLDTAQPLDVRISRSSPRAAEEDPPPGPRLPDPKV